MTLDYFDASINRNSAYTTEFRNRQKALLYALLEPSETIKKFQNENDITSLMGYQKMLKEAVEADFLIPSGELFQKLITSGIKKVHRDTFHASPGIGRYALGLLWYTVLTGNDINCNAFCDFDEEISETEIQMAKKMCYRNLLY